MNKVQTKRLLNVAVALREAHAAKQQFSMERWVFGDSGSIMSEWNDQTCQYTYRNEDAEFCGTPACALGHYASRGDLQHLLKVNLVKNTYNVEFASMDFCGAKPGTGFTSTEKVAEHFGITHSEFNELFDSNGCGGATTALQAAKYIEKFVKARQFPKTRRSGFRASDV